MTTSDDHTRLARLHDLERWAQRRKAAAEAMALPSLDEYPVLDREEYHEIANPECVDPASFIVPCGAENHDPGDEDPGSPSGAFAVVQLLALTIVLALGACVDPPVSDAPDAHAIADARVDADNHIDWPPCSCAPGFREYRLEGFSVCEPMNPRDPIIECDEPAPLPVCPELCPGEDLTTTGDHMTCRSGRICRLEIECIYSCGEGNPLVIECPGTNNCICALRGGTWHACINRELP